MERRKSNQNVILSSLITDAGNLEKKCFKLINKTITNFSSLHQFYKGNLNKFVLLLKNAYRYQYMDS